MDCIMKLFVKPKYEYKYDYKNFRAILIKDEKPKRKPIKKTSRKIHKD